jgi:hypothetical protein
MIFHKKGETICGFHDVSSFFLWKPEFLLTSQPPPEIFDIADKNTFHIHRENVSLYEKNVNVKSDLVTIVCITILLKN